MRKELESEHIKPSPSPAAIWFWQKVGLRTHECQNKLCCQVDRLPMLNDLNTVALMITFYSFTVAGAVSELYKDWLDTHRLPI